MSGYSVVRVRENEGNAGYRGVDTQLVGLERMRVMQVIEEWIHSW